MILAVHQRLARLQLLVGGFVAPTAAALAQNPAPPPALANWTGIAIRCTAAGNARD